MQINFKDIIKLNDLPPVGSSVIVAMSGGVDSSVAAVLINKAIGENLNCIFVNNGLLRKNEYTSVLNYYRKIGLKVKIKTEKKNSITDFCRDKCVKNFILRFYSEKGYLNQCQLY